ncbi:sigma factor-like helix-turn-helix DNA-binding protein [Streptomyces brasiliensis]|uniref:sigma factor-like helix-turn-helix DNA-binding protein n=1 Tax=Streptomyces brasiliensis TaxID=1954 RepID=UPI001E2BBCAD|nr:sigma factor-like helix-turn-helix DNA-binding protein [Streptomyces brasiliensis]
MFRPGQRPIRPPLTPTARRRTTTVPTACSRRWLPGPRCNCCPPEQGLVLVHLYWHGRTIQESAGILGVPTGTIKSRHCNALRNCVAGWRRKRPEPAPPRPRLAPAGPASPATVGGGPF